MTPKLLLADDSITIQRVIELTFADENVQVIAVGDGHQAIERIRADRPDIVLADVGMPEHDGYEVASFVKKNPELAHIPVLLLTGAFEPVDEGRAKSVGCEGVLVKPFEPQMVITRVRELLAKKPQASVEPARPAAVPSAVPTAARQETSASSIAEPEAEEPAAFADTNRDPLEDYFDRLDAALANISTVPPPPIEEEPPQGELGAPYPGLGLEPAPPPHDVVLNSGATLSPVPAEPSKPRSPAGATTTSPRTAIRPGPTAAPESAAILAGPSAPLHEAFAALLAAEERRPVMPASGEPMSEATIDAIVQRVLARLKDGEVRQLVVDTAERLVREEIERIKSLR